MESFAYEVPAPGRGELFTGRLIRLTAARPGDAETIARWTADSSYQTRMDTDLAVPKMVAETGGPPQRPADMVDLRIRPLDNDTLLGFVALFKIEWNNRTAQMAMGIGDQTNRRKG